MGYTGSTLNKPLVNIMFTVQTVKEKQYSVADLHKMVTNVAPRSGNGNSHADHLRKERCKLAMGMISKYLVNNRNGELEALRAPFKIVTNGYGELKYVEMSETGEQFDAVTIFRQMRKDEENGCTIPMVKV